MLPLGHHALQQPLANWKLEIKIRRRSTSIHDTQINMQEKERVCRTQDKQEAQPSTLFLKHVQLEPTVLPSAASAMTQLINWRSFFL